MKKNTRRSGAKAALARQAAGIDVLAELAALKAMTVPELQEKWQAIFGERAPNASRGNLELRLGYRIQELAHGGLRRETRRTRASRRPARSWSASGAARSRSSPS